MTDRHDDTLDFLTDNRLTPLFDSLDEGVLVWDKDRTLRYANAAARGITKLPLPVGSALPPGIEHMSMRVLTKENTSIVTGELPVYRAFNGVDVPREEMRFIDPEGHHRWLSVSAKRILDTSGGLLYVTSSLRDISLRKARESKLTFMVESAKILSMNLDFDQRLTEKAKLAVPTLADWCSVTVLESGSLRRVALVHKDPRKVEQLIRFDERYPHTVMMDAIKQKKPVFVPIVTDDTLKSQTLSEEHYRDQVALGVISMVVVPIVSHGESVGAMTFAYAESGRTYNESDLEFLQEFSYHLSVVFDNARLFEEIELRDKSKDIFLAALSHELRNPLAPIKSSLELLKIRGVPTELREEFDIIEHQFDHMAHLLNDLLDVTRFTQDRISLSSHPVELRRLIERAQRTTDSVVRKSDITLHFAYPSMPVMVVADETRLEQAVSNLLSNAVKFTPPDGSIWVDLERDQNDAVIRVRDNGEGIDAIDLPNIFDMYYQGRNKSLVNNGLGIGLLLVQRIVGLHGGSITAESEGHGLGSEFVIRLPLVEMPAAKNESSAPKSPAYSMRILVVDDNAPAADSLVRLLNKLGADARAVYSAHEALGSEQLHMVDLFLLDVGMPHMDGYELVSALRKRGISAPIVALTGYGLSEDKQRAEDAGFTSHLTKPVGVAELNTVFENVLAPAV